MLCLNLIPLEVRLLMAVLVGYRSMYEPTFLDVVNCDHMSRRRCCLTPLLLWDLIIFGVLRCRSGVFVWCASIIKCARRKMLVLKVDLVKGIMYLGTQVPGCRPQRWCLQTQSHRTIQHTQCYSQVKLSVRHMIRSIEIIPDQATEMFDVNTKIPRLACL